MPDEPINAGPGPDPKSDPSAEASSRGSGRASQSDLPAFIGDPGPAFDAEAAAAEPPPVPPGAAAQEAPAELVQWEEEVIGGLLGMQGRLLHAGAGVAESDWLYTELDLAAIAPPLTRIANRYEPVRQYAKFGDPITLATALISYATRSLLERRSALDALGGDGGTRPIPPAGEETPPAAGAPTPETAPRQAPPGPPPPMQPSEGPAAVSPPRPAEAAVDPTAVEWRVGE